MKNKKHLLALGILSLVNFSSAYSYNIGPVFGPSGSYMNSCHTFYQLSPNSFYALCEGDRSFSFLPIADCDLNKDIWNDHGTLRCSSNTNNSYTITGNKTSASFVGSRSCNWFFGDNGQTLNISCEGKPWRNIGTESIIRNCSDLSNDHGIVKCNKSPI